MAHPCCLCGSECYCHGDIDDVVVSKTPKNCDGCGCREFGKSQGWGDDEDYFEPCAKCDGHAACEDFGCAIENGLGHLVKKELTSDDF